MKALELIERLQDAVKENGGEDLPVLSCSVTTSIDEVKLDDHWTPEYGRHVVIVLS